MIPEKDLEEFLDESTTIKLRKGQSRSYGYPGLMKEFRLKLIGMEKHLNYQCHHTVPRL